MSSASARFSSSSRSMRSMKDFSRSPATPATSAMSSLLDVFDRDTRAVSAGDLIEAIAARQDVVGARIVNNYPVLLRRLLRRRLGPPAQHRLARRRGLVEAAARRQIRRALGPLGPGAPPGAGRPRLDHCFELFGRGLALRLGLAHPHGAPGD